MDDETLKEKEMSEADKFKIAMSTKYDRTVKDFNKYELSDHFKSFYR